MWWGRWSPDRRSSVRLSSGAFLLVSPRVFGHQTRHHHLFLQMRTTSCQDSQIAIVTRLHTPVSCTLCIVHPSTIRDIINERARVKFADLDGDTPITAFFKDLNN